MGIYEKPSEKFLHQLKNVFGFDPPANDGYDTVECIHAMHKGKAKVFIAMGGNFLSATPDTSFTAEALRKCKLTVHVSTKLGAAWGDIDNDGDEDLFESVSSSSDHLWLNQNGLLTNVTTAYRVDQLTRRATRQTLFVDYNGDGRLDLASVSLRSPTLSPQLPDGTFGHGQGVDRPMACTSDGQWGHLVDISDGSPGLEVVCAPRIATYPKVNAFANGAVSDITAQYAQIGPINDAVTLDYDGDLRPDLFLVRGSERASDAYQYSPSGLEVQFITAVNKSKDKRWIYEESIHMPFIIRWPGVVKHGTRFTPFIQNIDYAPTFVEMAGGKTPDGLHGKSFVPILRGEKPSDWRTNVYYHYYDFKGAHNVANHYGVRTERYTLAHYYATDEWEMFDNKKDPRQLRSVYAEPACAMTVANLKAELNRLRALYKVTNEDEVDPPTAR